MSKTKKKNDPFVDELLPGEEILWQGQSEFAIGQFAKMRRWHWKIAAAMSFFLAGMGYLFFQNSVDLIMIGFLLATAALLLGMILDVEAFKTTLSEMYAVTKKRLLIYSKYHEAHHIIRIDDISSMFKAERNKGLQLLIFVNDNNIPIGGFESISDADEVYKLIYDLQSELKQEAISS